MKPPRGAALAGGGVELKARRLRLQYHHTALPRFPRDNPSCVSRKPQENGSALIDISVVGNWVKLYKTNAVLEQIRKCMDFC